MAIMFADHAGPTGETSTAAAPESGSATICPDGASLTVDALSAAARNPDVRIEITPEIRERVVASRELLDEFVASGRIIYGVTTSVGGFVNWLVPPSMAGEVQNNILRCVQSNVGPPLDDAYVRAAMLARINSLGRGFSAISLENLEKYIAMFNRGILPIIPEKGSLGTSGDLGPLACIALVGTGQWRAKYQGALELSRRPETPVRVVVSEYVDLAGAFFGGKEPGLVNGVLDRLARELRPEAFEAPGAS